MKAHIFALAYSAIGLIFLIVTCYLGIRDELMWLEINGEKFKNAKLSSRLAISVLVIAILLSIFSIVYIFKTISILEERRDLWKHGESTIQMDYWKFTTTNLIIEKGQNADLELETTLLTNM